MKRIWDDFPVYSEPLPLAKARDAWNWLLDLIWPRFCPFCNTWAEKGALVCAKCREELAFTRNGHCIICGIPAETENSPDFVCGACRREKPLFAAARSACPFNTAVRSIVHAFKYKGATWFAPDMAKMIIARLRQENLLDCIDCVVPVPLHPVRLRERTYNQAALLAEEIAKRIDRRCDKSALVRTVPTVSQTALNMRERKRNVSNVFKYKHPEMTRGRTILLVDDVMTTGSTLSSCSRELLKAGAWRVFAATFARALAT